MGLGAVDLVSNIEPQQNCVRHAQSKIKSIQTNMPTIVRKRELSVNGIWVEFVLHILLDALYAQHQALEDAYSEIEMMQRRMQSAH